MTETTSDINTLHRSYLGLETYLLEGKCLLDIFPEAKQTTPLVATNRIKFKLVILLIFEKAIDDIIVLSFAF